MNVTIFDYTVGNVHSLATAFSHVGADVKIETKLSNLDSTDVFVLPGVGSFAPAVEAIEPYREMILEYIENGNNTIGVCLGMQLFFDESQEGPGNGLGIFPGSVDKIASKRVPHMGWNEIVGDEILLSKSGLSKAYYANSYICNPNDKNIISATTEHDGVNFSAIIRNKNVVGVQFHPEKSSMFGLKFLKTYLEEISK